MTRKNRLGLLLLALAAVCAAAAAAVLLSPEETAEEDTSFPLLELEAEDITQLSWSYGDQTQSFTYDPEDGWSYPADSAFPLDPALLESMADALSQLTAYRAIEGAEDLSQYGLEEPQARVSFTADGSQYTLDIGDETAMGGQRYVCLGEDSVYLTDASVLDDFSCGLYDLVAQEDIPTMTQLTAFTVETGSRTLELEYLEDSGLAWSDHYVWFLKDGEDTVTLDTELTDAFVENITLLYWSKCVDYKAQGSALAAYGLDEPAAVVTVDYVVTTQEDSGLTDDDGNVIYNTLETPHTFVLEIGDYDGEYCYARIAGSSLVYYIDAGVADAMLYLQAGALLPDDILILDRDTVESVDITLDGESYHVEKLVEETTDEEGDTTQQTVWTLDGEEVEFQSVFTALTGLESTGSEEGLTPERGAEISFTFHRNTDTYQTLTLTFYQYDSANCLVEFNGETRLLAGRDSVLDIVEQVNAMVLD